jgi:hypothetical protein
MRPLTTLVVVMLLAMTGVMWLKAGKVGYEYGKPDELKGVSVIFIDTGSQLTVRNIIADEIGKKLPELSIAENIGQAEIVLDFTLEIDRQADQGGIVIYGGIGTLGSHGGVDIYQPVETTREHGHGLIYRPLGEDAIRILLEYRSKKSTMFHRSPAIQFARKFVDEFQKANR